VVGVKPDYAVGSIATVREFGSPWRGEFPGPIRPDSEFPKRIMSNERGEAIEQAGVREVDGLRNARRVLFEWNDREDRKLALARLIPEQTVDYYGQKNWTDVGNRYLEALDPVVLTWMSPVEFWKKILETAHGTDHWQISIGRGVLDGYTWPPLIDPGGQMLLVTFQGSSSGGELDRAKSVVRGFDPLWPSTPGAWKTWISVLKDQPPSGALRRMRKASVYKETEVKDIVLERDEKGHINQSGYTVKWLDMISKVWFNQYPYWGRNGA